MSRCSSVEAHEASRVEHGEIISLRLRGSVEMVSYAFINETLQEC